MMHTDAEKISDMEAEIMKVVWNAKTPVTFSEIRFALHTNFDVGNQSIQTMIKRLIGKKVLKQEKKEVYYYAALVSEADYVKSKTMNLVKKVFNGDARGLMSALIRYQEVSQEDLEELQAFWQKGRDADD